MYRCIQQVKNNDDNSTHSRIFWLYSPIHFGDRCQFSWLGAVLTQQNDLVVLGYASRGPRPAERNMNYSSMNLELLAIYWAVEQKFRDLLIGSTFVLFTDNNLLSYLQSTIKLGATYMRWSAELVQFNFTIKSRSGKSNANAYPLSRKTSHGKEATTARLERITSNASQVQSKEAGTLLPSSIRTFVEVLSSQPLLSERLEYDRKV